jgi:erythromycin esterase-like protein
LNALARIKDHIARNAVRFAEPFNGLTADIACLSVLDEAVAGADIVVLGELNHFVHEKSDFRLFFCRYLLSRGFTTFAEELGWSDGARVSRYLEAGDEGELRRLPSFGYNGHKRGDRDDRPTGLLKRTFEAYPTGPFLAEQSRFYRGLRTAWDGRRFHYFGFDIDGSPGGTYEDVAQSLLPYGVGGASTAFPAALARVKDESIAEEVGRLKRARELVPGHVPNDVANEVRASLSALIDSLEYVAATYAAKSYNALRPGMALREEAMKRRLADIEMLLVTANKLVLMGHALHLVKDDSKLGASTSGVGPGGGRTCSLGHHLAREKGRRACAIWFLYGGGEDSQPFADLPRRAAFPNDTLNHMLAEFQTPLFFRTDDPALRESVRIGHMYNALVELPLGAQTDAVFFLPRVTPLVPEPELPSPETPCRISSGSQESSSLR